MKTNPFERAMKKIDGRPVVFKMDTRTQVTLRGGKSNPMVGRVQKVTKNALAIAYNNSKGSQYAGLVNDQLRAEGKRDTFVAQPPRWGQRIDGTPIVEHEGDKYVEVVIASPGVVSYELDGQPIDRSMIVGLPPEPQAPQQGGVDNHIALKRYGLESVERMRIKGRTVKDYSKR